MKTQEPTLVIMAAGMGSRFGGLKQIAPVDDEGHIIIDYSVYDALKAGFKKIVCIINPKNEKDFAERFQNVPIEYAHQTLEILPEGYSVPPGREKPWGTAHAIHTAASKIGGAFAVINADDLYGYGSFKLVYDYLTASARGTILSTAANATEPKNVYAAASKDMEPESMETPDNRYAVVGYKIENTITESGSVARGVLNVEDGKLVSIDEMLEIVIKDGIITNKGLELPPHTLVSMNMWCFKHGLLDEIENRFKNFLEQGLKDNPLKCEFLLPVLISDLLKEKIVEVDVLPSVEKWYGVTNAADLPGVKAAIALMKQGGKYPQKLWG